ncbi:hypothetical protein JMJ35_006060 [Cladonia borealis]|uniref:Nephrocystin 3-like N-terminal domain-containing protein n=1 Tax=Cladonia borealis TaxID=184061 RepID=A0AA39QYC5_9LECA|nr:hypothetical protein JMJ35_006060 [Cladonia borealis]
MAELQDRSVSVSTKCGEALTYHQETRGELTIQSLSRAKDQVDTKIVGIIADHLKDLQVAVAAHPQTSERTSYNEKEKKIHETLTAADRIISEILGLIGLPQSLSPEKLIKPLAGLISTIETPGIDVDHVYIPSSVRSALSGPWRKTGQKVDGGIKAILNNIASFAALIQMNADSEERRLQDLQRLTEEKRQALSELEMKNQELSWLESQLSFLQGLRLSPPSNSNIDQPLLKGSDLKRRVALEIRSILETLYHPSRPYKDLVDSYSKRHKQLRANRLDGTCTWFIRTQSFGSWLAGGSPRLLWCYGAPGIGKSTIISLIITGLASKSNEQNYAFYYMGYGKVQSAAGLILSLLEQLCADGAEIPPSLKQFRARNSRHPKIGLEALINALKDVSQETTADTTIIIDGWDECNMDSEDEFRRLFGVLKTLRWKICITSRRPPTDPDPAYCSTLQIQQTDNAEDVRAFTENATQHTLLLKYQGFRQEAIQNILELSHGIYLWAKLSVKMILEIANLKIIGSKTTSSYLSQMYLPQPAPTIKRALEAIGKKPGRTGELSKVAMTWIAELKRPLSLAALLESLSIGGEHQPVGVDASVIDWCDGLVMVDEGNSYVHLAPYEIDEAAKDIWSESYNTTVRMLASNCVNYLMLEEEFGRGCRETEEEMIRLLAANPFLDYAARCWAYHRRDICEFRSSHTNGEAELDDNFKLARFSEIGADNGFQDGQPDAKVLPLSNFDDDAGEKDVQDDNTEKKRVQNLNVTSGPGIQDITETMLEKPNFLLALQILLYRDNAAAPFTNQWAVHKEKINSMSKLHKAARFGLTSLVDKLAMNGSDLCEKDSEGSTALHEAAKEGFEDVIERLLKDDSSSALVMNNYKKTPMHLAMARGHHGAFIILLEKSCEGLWREELRREELRREELKRGELKKWEFRKWMLERDHSPFANVEDGDELITYYSIQNSGISNDPKRSKEIALSNAINLRKGGVVSLLLNAGVDANCRDEADVPALWLAIVAGSLPILKVLLDNDANTRAKALNYAGEPSLHLAARLGMTDVLELLLWEGAWLLEVDKLGRTVLFSALEASNVQAGYDIITILLRGGIDVNKKDHNGRSILHPAAQKGNSMALRSLIWRIHDPSHKDAKGKTPLDYAREGGHKDAEEILRDHIARYG